MRQQRNRGSPLHPRRRSTSYRGSACSTKSILAPSAADRNGSTSAAHTPWRPHGMPPATSSPPPSVHWLDGNQDPQNNSKTTTSPPLPSCAAPQFRLSPLLSLTLARDFISFPNPPTITSRAVNTYISGPPLSQILATSAFFH